ncbi:hypothetical protein [Prevotella histicola]
MKLFGVTEMTGNSEMKHGSSFSIVQEKKAQRTAKQRPFSVY